MRRGRSQPFNPIIKRIWFGTRYTKSFTETLTITEPAFLRALGKLSKETITITDAIIKTSTRIVTDTVTITDTLSKIYARLVSYTETINISDSISRAFTRLRTEIIIITDSYSQFIPLLKSFTDTITMSDTVSKIFILIRNFTDTVRTRDWLWRQIRKARRTWRKENGQDLTSDWS